MHFRCVVGFVFCSCFLVNFCSVLLMFVFCFSLFGVFVFETSCILGELLDLFFALVFLFFFVVLFAYVCLLFYSFWGFCF